MNKQIRLTHTLVLLMGLSVLSYMGCEKTYHKKDSTPRGKYGYIYDDSLIKPIAGVDIVGYSCDDIQSYIGCNGPSVVYDRKVTDTAGFFQLVYVSNHYYIDIMGYELIRTDYNNNIYYVRHW